MSLGTSRLPGPEIEPACPALQGGFLTTGPPGRSHYLNSDYLTHLDLLICQSVSPVAQSCPTLCDPMNCSMPGLLVRHQLPEFTQTHVHQVSDAIQPSHPLSSPSPPAPNLFQHQGLFKSVSASHQVARVLEFQLQHQSFQ